MEKHQTPCYKCRYNHGGDGEYIACGYFLIYGDGISPSILSTNKIKDDKEMVPIDFFRHDGNSCAASDVTWILMR